MPVNTEPEVSENGANVASLERPAYAIRNRQVSGFEETRREPVNTVVEHVGSRMERLLFTPGRDIETPLTVYAVVEGFSSGFGNVKEENDGLRFHAGLCR